MSSVMPALILIFLFSISLDELSIVIFSSLLFSSFSRLQMSVGSLLKANLEKNQKFQHEVIEDLSKENLISNLEILHNLSGCHCH